MAEVFNYELMSEPQSDSMPAALAGNDVFLRAKTGSGKTIGFLLPSINRLLASGPGRGDAIKVLVLAPTR